MEKIVIKYLNKKFKKKKIKIDKNTILLNGGLELDSIEFVNLIVFIEKNVKKKFKNEGYSKLFGIKVVNFLKFFK
jgi:acyl carrier protein